MGVSDDKKISDEDERFNNDPEAIYRIYNVISYFIVLVIIGLPIWWFTTRVYRASLPLEEMLRYDISNKTIRENSIPLSLEYDILITILNPNPKNLSVNLDGRVLKKNLEPFLKTLEPIADFTVKSQWIYLMELGVQPEFIGNKFIVYEDQLPHIITPLEKKIWSHLSPRPTLNLVTYFSRCDTPVHIHTRLYELVESNAFLNPRWGGISIMNADKEACIKGVFTPDVAKIVAIYITQLQELIGFRGNAIEDVDHLVQTKAMEMIQSTRRTLKSLALLLSEINSIVISDEVASKIKLALENANKADDYLNKSDLNNGLKAAKVAYYNSEGAFSDPSLLTLLYFPDDQKYAIYIPLFLPIMIPVFMSLLALQQWWRQERTKRSSKLSKTQDKEWACTYCTLLNSHESSICLACSNPKIKSLHSTLLNLDNDDLIANTEVFECAICFLEIQPGLGVTLKGCLHQFCKQCLADLVEHSDEAEIKCPFRDDQYSCGFPLQDREIKALVSRRIYEQYLTRSVVEAEKRTRNSFHCKTADCKGWCIYEDDVNTFRCPACSKDNCLTCRAIHEGMNCKQYQEKVKADSRNNENAKKTEEAIKAMIKKGEAMHCPGCKVVLMMKYGCDWLQCTACKMEICWVTKGPRWGPRGRNDITGGCRCRVYGVICHPKCRNCH